MFKTFLRIFLGVLLAKSLLSIFPLENFALYWKNKFSDAKGIICKNVTCALEPK
jgi:hypothetical protein